MEESTPGTARVTSPILIVGARRSGTTLLRAILSQHPDLLVHPAEPQFILDLYRRFGRCVYNVPEAVAYVRDHPHRAPAISSWALENAYRECKQLSLQEFVRRYLWLWVSKERQQKRAVLKDPYFIRHLDLMFELFPAATFIHIVRDPRANVSSQRARWSRATTWECLRWWRDAVRAGHRLARQQPHRCIELRYEDLITTPEQTLRPLCRFLHVPFLSELLEFELETISFVPGKEPEPVRFTRLDPTRLTQWQKYLSPLEVRLVEAGGRKEMAWYQYEATNPPVSLVALAVRLLQERVRYQMRAAARQIRDGLRQMMRFIIHRPHCDNG